MEEREERAGVKSAVKTAPVSQLGRPSWDYECSGLGGLHFTHYSTCQHEVWTGVCLYVPHTGCLSVLKWFWQHRRATGRVLNSSYELSFIEGAWLCESGEAFIKVIANINLQSCKGFGLSVTTGEIQHNHWTPTASLTSSNFTLACHAVRCCDLVW